MAIIRHKELARMNKSDREKRLKELGLELIKAKANAAKTGSSKIKEIKKTIARIHTLNNSHKEVLDHN